MSSSNPNATKDPSHDSSEKPSAASVVWGLGYLGVYSMIAALPVVGAVSYLKDHTAEVHRERATAEITLKEAGVSLDPTKPVVVSVPAATGANLSKLDKGAVSYRTDSDEVPLEDASVNTAFKMDVPDDFSQHDAGSDPPLIFAGPKGFAMVVPGSNNTEKGAPVRQWILKHDIAADDVKDFKITIALDHNAPDARATSFYTNNRDLVLQVTEPTPHANSQVFFEVQDTAGQQPHN